MPSSTKKKPRRGQSTLERHPDHVKAIGMITVELANLELMAATLLAALIDRPAKIGHAIYFSPNAASARLDIVASVILEHMEAHPRLMKKATRHINKARDIMNRRNRYIHDAWGVIDGSNVVIRGRQPLHRNEGDIIPLKTLTDDVSALRRMIAELHEFSAQVHLALWPEASPETPS